MLWLLWLFLLWMPVALLFVVVVVLLWCAAAVVLVALVAVVAIMVVWLLLYSNPFNIFRKGSTMLGGHVDRWLGLWGVPKDEGVARHTRSSDVQHYPASSIARSVSSYHDVSQACHLTEHKNIPKSSDSTANSVHLFLRMTGRVLPQGGLIPVNTKTYFNA